MMATMFLLPKIHLERSRHFYFPMKIVCLNYPMRKFNTYIHLSSHSCFNHKCREMKWENEKMWMSLHFHSRRLYEAEVSGKLYAKEWRRKKAFGRMCISLAKWRRYDIDVKVDARILATESTDIKTCAPLPLPSFSSPSSYLVHMNEQQQNIVYIAVLWCPTNYSRNKKKTKNRDRPNGVANKATNDGTRRRKQFVKKKIAKWHHLTKKYCRWTRSTQYILWFWHRKRKWYNVKLRASVIWNSNEISATIWHANILHGVTTAITTEQ